MNPTDGDSEDTSDATGATDAPEAVDAGDAIDATAAVHPTDLGDGRDDGQVIQRSSLRRNVAQMASSQVVTWVLATVTAVIVPRWLGPDILGRFSLAVSLWGIASVFTVLGTSMYLQLAISRDQRDGLKLMAPVFVARTGAFVLASSLLAIYVSIAENDSMFVAIMIMSGVSTLFVLWGDVYGAAFTGLERMSILAGLSVVGRFVTLVATVAVLSLGYDVYGVVGVGIGTSLANLGLLAWWFRRFGRIDTSRAWSHVRPVILAGIPFMMVTLALMIYRQVDVIVISRVAGDRDLGWYAAADLLAGSLLFPTTIVMAPLFPTFGRLFADDPVELHNLVRRTFSTLLLVAVPIGLGAAVVGPTFAPLLFGDEFDGTGQALVIFGPVTIISFGTTLLAYLALATERSRFLATLLLVMAVLTIGLDAVLVPWASERFDNGAIGGALAYVVTEVLQFTISLAVIAPFVVTRRWAWLSFRVLAAGGVMVVATLPFRNELFLIPAAIGALVYPVAILLFRAIDTGQKTMIGELLARLGLRTRWAP